MDVRYEVRIEDLRAAVRAALEEMRQEGVSYRKMLAILDGMARKRYGDGEKGVFFPENRVAEIGRLLTPDYKAGRELLNEYAFALWGAQFEPVLLYRPAFAPQWRALLDALEMTPTECIEAFVHMQRPDLWHMIPTDGTTSLVIDQAGRATVRKNGEEVWTQQA